MNDVGDAIIVYVGSDGSIFDMVFTNEYRNGRWLVPSTIDRHLSPDLMNTFNPQVAMSNNGYAVITWVQNYFTKIYKAEYRNGVWIVPHDLQDGISPSSAAFGQKVAVSDQNSALITWHQYYNDRTNYMFKSQYPR